MTNQQLKAHCEDVISSPALYCIVDPDGLPYMSEICVATDPGVLEDEVAAMNDELEDGEPKYTVQPLFFASKPIELPKAERLDGNGYGYYFDMDDVFVALDDAGVKYEVKS